MKRKPSTSGGIDWPIALLVAGILMAVFGGTAGFAPLVMTGIVCGILGFIGMVSS